MSFQYSGLSLLVQREKMLRGHQTNDDAFQDTPSSFNLLTPGDNQNLNESNIS